MDIKYYAFGVLFVVLLNCEGFNINIIPTFTVTSSTSSSSLLFLSPLSLSSTSFSLRMIPKLVMLDRDGVINVDLGTPGVLNPDRLSLLPNSARAIGNLKRAGCAVVLVTNQSCVGKGLLSIKGLEAVHNRLHSLLRSDDADAVLDGVYICTSLSEDNDVRRKPGPGMIVEAYEDYSVHAADCVFIGDTLTDLQAAASAGVRLRVLVQTGYGLKVMNGQTAKQLQLQLESDCVAKISEGHQRILHNPDVMLSVLPFAYATDLFQAVQWIIS